MAKVIKGTGAPIGSGEELGAISPDTGFADVVRKRPAVVTRETFDAGNDAKRIVADAEAKAQQIVAEAEQKATEIQRQAQVEAEQLRAGAEQQGFKQGSDEAAAKFTELIAEHSKKMEAAESSVANQVRQLSLAIAKKIINKELEFHPETVVEMAKKHLTSVRQRKEVYLRVSPADLETLREHKRELIDQLGRAKDMEIRADETLTSGSMIIETDAGTIDARVETQMAVIERVLLGKKPI